MKKILILFSGFVIAAMTVATFYLLGTGDAFIYEQRVAKRSKCLPIYFDSAKHLKYGARQYEYQENTSPINEILKFFDTELIPTNHEGRKGSDLWSRRELANGQFYRCVNRIGAQQSFSRVTETGCIFVTSKNLSQTRIEYMWKLSEDSSYCESKYVIDS